MKKMSLKLAGIFAPIILGMSMIVVVVFTGGNNYSATIFESEQDYKLKFVDSTDFLALSESSALILPFEILSAEEGPDGIIVSTYENSVILAPTNCEVLSNNVSRKELELKNNNIRLVITGLISGVVAGKKIQCGEVLGTVDGNQCVVNVFWGDRRLSLEELKVII